MRSIAEGTWYRLSDIEHLVMEPTTSGRIYLAYHEPFSITAQGGLPSFLAPSSPAYRKRFDKFELTFDGSPHSVADLTAAIDEAVADIDRVCSIMVTTSCGSCPSSVARGCV